MTSSESYYYLTDGLGSTMATVDTDGDVVNEYTYDVFGETRSESGAQANEFQFAGQQVDGSTGLQYLRARYYDMETGVFLSREPMLTAPGWAGNPTSYALANPLVLEDQTGLWPSWSDVKKVASGSLSSATAVVNIGVSSVNDCLHSISCSATVGSVVGGIAAVVGFCALTAGAGCPAALAAAGAVVGESAGGCCWRAELAWRLYRAEC